MPDESDRPTPGPRVLVLRAAFVPDGEDPPPELSSVFRPLHMPATLNPATGEITCDNAGVSFGGDILAEWHPDATQESLGEDEPQEEETPDSDNGPGSDREI